MGKINNKKKSMCHFIPFFSVKFEQFFPIFEKSKKREGAFYANIITLDIH